MARLFARPNRTVSLLWLNGSSAVRVDSNREPTVVNVIVEQGRISRIYATANPDKLTRLEKPAQPAR